MAAAAAEAVRGGSAEQSQDREAADRAGVSPDRSGMIRKQRRAAEARERHEKQNGPKKQYKRKRK